MKKEYDFSKGERGKFYRPDAELYLPIYIEPDMMEMLRKCECGDVVSYVAKS